MRRLKSMSKLVFLLYCLWMIGVSSLIFAEVEKDLLDMSLEELMNVKITTADRTPEKIWDIPASVVLITRKDIETHGYRTLSEILENIPGLYAIDNYDEDGINFGVRGFWSGVPNDNMIILVNDVSQENDFHSNYPTTKISIPVEAIDRIEVIRGPMSVIYGNGAFYGVINIFTNDFSQEGAAEKSKDMPVNIVSSSIGSENTKKIFVKSAGKKNDFKYVFNASLYDTYGIDQPLIDMVSNPAVFSEYKVPADQRTGGRLENNEKYFNFSGMFKDFYLNLSYGESKIESYYLMPSFSDGNLNINNNTIISLGYKKKFSDRVNFDGKVSYSKSRTWQEYDFLSEDFFGIQQLDAESCEIELNTFINPSNKIDITTGIYYRLVLDARNMYDIPSFETVTLENNILFLDNHDNILTRALYTQVNYRLLPRLTFVGGIRFEQMSKYNLEAILAGGTENFKKDKKVYDQDEVEIIPRLAAIYSIKDKHFFKFLYGQAINRPSFFQNTLNLLLEPGKGSLKPESIQTLELNYVSSLNKNFTLNLSVFRNILKNLITRVGEFDDNGDYQTWSANAGKMVTYGTELTINAEPFKNFRFEVSGTLQETEDKRPGYENIDVAYSPKILGYMKASYRTKDFTLALTSNYVGSMETFWDETKPNANGSTGARIGERVDGYFLLGANLRVDNLFIKGLFLNVRCSNLLNEEIRYPTFTNNEWADRGTLGSGRTFLLSLGLKF